jgi:heptosyltransferase-2
MSLPCLHALLETEIPIVVCARPWARDLLAAYDLAGFIEMKGRWREDRAVVSAFRKKAQHAHPRGLLLPDSLSSAMVFKFAGIPSAGYRDDGRSLILRWPLHKLGAGMHAVESWYYIAAQALKCWGRPMASAHPPRKLGLRILDKHRSEAMRAIENAGLTPGEFVLIAPTATGLHRGKVKVWPYFNELTQRLQERGHIVVMCPPPAEAQAALQNAPDALCLPALNLGAFATLTQLASLVVCNDSGVSHVAAAAGAKQLTLFGVTQHLRTGPWSDNATCLGSAHGWPTLEEAEQQVLALLP